MRSASTNPGVRPTLERHRILELEDYSAALQHRGDFPGAVVVRVHQAVVLLGIAAIALYLLMYRKHVASPIALALFVVAAGVVGNALVLGVLSVPQDRYGTRVMWLMPACAILLWWPLLKHSRQRPR